MKAPVTITTCLPHNFEKGDFISVNGKTHRVVDVPSQTTMIVERPWWIPLHDTWSYVRAPFSWARYRLRNLWFLLRYGDD